MSAHLTSQLFLVGAGKMGGALLEGWVEQGIEPEQVTVLDPALGTGSGALIQERRITINPDLEAQDNAEVIVLAVKPQVMDQVLPSLLPLVHDGVLVISIAAGISLDFLARHLGEETAIVRAMPNTPAAVGAGMSVAVPNGHVSPKQKELAGMLLNAVGEVDWINDELQMDAVTAVSGSGPAYVFLLVECMAAAGRKLGLEPELAMRIARQTVIGSGELMRRSPAEAAVLRKDVTSPGGTTEAALKVLMDEAALEKLMGRAIEAAAKRSVELS